MHIDNNTGRTAAFTLGRAPSGRESVVLVVKENYDFPEAEGAVCQPSETPAEMILADEFWGEPGHSSPRREMDFAPEKPMCDVLLDACAYAPNGRPAEKVRVGVQVGNWSKIIDVVGGRVWVEGVGAPSVSGIEPFSKLAIHYGVAFGGVDDLDEDDDLPGAYLPNPAGRGWHRVGNQNRLNGTPLPHTEAPGEPIRSPWGTYQPMSFGPVARGWPQRLRYGGTYDQNWQDNVFPFLPEDFDPRFHQGAPEDQQIPYPKGGEPVTLMNLTPEGRVSFRLPDLSLPAVFERKRGEDVTGDPVVDTIFIEPELRRLSLTWRCSLPLENDIFEVPRVFVGKRSKGFWRARALGKQYYPSLGALVRSKRGKTEDA